MTPRERPQRKIGLALGSGAARGLAHIGVLRVLEEEKIAIDCIAGTSIGAFIAALYAAGVPVSQMHEVAVGIDWKKLARLLDPVLPTSGLLDGVQVSEFMARLLPVTTFEELRLPLAVTATDVESGEAMIVRRGNLLDALRAAVAFPGIFTPVRFGNRFLIDGGLCHPVPVDAVRDLGANHIIAVCAIPRVEKPLQETYLPPTEKDNPPDKTWLPLFNAPRIERLFSELWQRNKPDRRANPDQETGRRPPSLLKVCAQSVAIMENQINQLRLAQNRVDLLIRPDFGDLTMLEFHRADEAIAAGERAMREKIDQLQALK